MYSGSESLALFHPVIQEWFRSRFAAPTEPQEQGWPSIAAGQHTLISAPTGSGKTLTAFLAVIDRLFREAAAGLAPEGMQVVYISPLRALSNDMQRNLSGPLAEIQQTAAEMGISIPEIRTGLRTGDTPSYQRAQLIKKPPQILVTTPESLYLMLTSQRSRDVLRSVNAVIVDEIHALVRDKRGSHLALSLERLAALVDAPLQRIGLSATQKPIERMAEFLVGCPRKESGDASSPACQIIDVGHGRKLDLGIEIPPSDLQAVCSHDQWAQVNERIIQLINSHRSTLIFVNTRRLAERLTHQLTQLLGEEAVGSHHGSLSKEIRLTTEQKLKEGQLKAVVATSSLELGIDVGYIDLVIQIGSPRGIAPFLQRIGRSGHALGLVPKGRLFALTRDELVECMGLMRAVNGGRLDVTPIPEKPLDILAQQIVAEVAAEEWDADDLYRCFSQAWPYRNLSRGDFDQTLTMLSQGLTDNTRQRALIYHDQLQRRVKGRRAARLAAISNGGAIAEVDTIRVVLEDENTVVGSVDEEFGTESNAGDIFLLGNTSWRILRLRGNDLIVADAQGAPPTIPFWRGEAPGRTIELSEEVARLREEMETRLIAADQLRTPAEDEAVPGSDVDSIDAEQAESFPPAWQPIVDWLSAQTHCSDYAARQVVVYMAAQRAAIGLLPTQRRIVFERFFDESGGMQLVVHAPFGGRINRGWGLAFRKRFCRSFDFELQASSDDDGFLLSLGPQHSFPIESLFPMMRPDNARNLLEQALLAVPMFHLRWRWNVTRALFVARMRNGKKVAPALQRFRSEDLLTAVFPKLTGCQENITGDHEIPDHPLVQQTVSDCLFEALDIDGLIEVLKGIENQETTLIARDTREPSPFAYEILNANPYAFLDGGEVQERRARAVATRRSLNVEGLRDLGRLDPRAIDEVVSQAQPEIRDADELHDLLLSRVIVPWRQSMTHEQSLGRHAVETCTIDAEQYASEFEELRTTGRAWQVEYADARMGWLATESLPAATALFPVLRQIRCDQLPESLRRDWSEQDALLALLRGWTETSGPVTAVDLACLLQLPPERIFASLEALEGEGLLLRGKFADPESTAQSSSLEIEWCHRRLLARIHRQTISGLRQEIEAVDTSVFIEFLARHQSALPGHQRSGADAVYDVVAQLQGLDRAAGAWEQAILPLRIADYRASWLDQLCLSGEIGWGRLEPPARKKSNARPMASMTRAIPVSLFLREDWDWLSARPASATADELSASAAELLEILTAQGAMFSSDLLKRLQLLPAQLDDLLGELVAAGALTADGFAGLRQLIRADQSDVSAQLPHRFRRVRKQRSGLGRWTLLDKSESPLSRDEIVDGWAWQLIRRWGVVFRDLVLREPLAPPWWELLRVYRRLEARGELRGGRFIRGVSGEQFGTSEAIRELRAIRNEQTPTPLLVLSGADPLNLTGIIGDDARVPTLSSHQVAYLRGVLVGWKKGDEHWISPELDLASQNRLHHDWQITPVRQSCGLGTSSEEAESAGRTEQNAQAEKPRQRRRRKTQKRSGIPKPFPF